MRLFDTSFLIDLVKGDEGAVGKAAEVDEERTPRALSVITVHEYLRGIFYCHSMQPAVLGKKLKRAEVELAKFEIFPYTYEIAKVAAEVDGVLRKNGVTLDLADVMVAATALHYKLTMVTRNVKHFKRVPELKIEKY